MSEGEKLHRILEFIAKTGEKSYTYEELIPAYKYGFFRKPNEKEMERLCAILIYDELVSLAPSKKSGGILIKPAAIAAFYEKRYFQEEEKTGYSSQAILVALIIVGVVGGGFLWLGVIVNNRGEKIQQAEERNLSAEKKIQEAGVLDQQRVKQIQAITRSRDSLQNIVRRMDAQIESIKKKPAKQTAKGKKSKK